MLRISKFFLVILFSIIGLSSSNLFAASAVTTLGGVECEQDKFKNFRLTAAQVGEPSNLKFFVEDLQKRYPHTGLYFEQPIMDPRWVPDLKILGFDIDAATVDKDTIIWLFRNGRDIPAFSHTTQGANVIVYCPPKKTFLLVLDAALDFWTLPAGGVDLGELPAMTAVREVKEETNISLTSPLKLIALLARTKKDLKLGNINSVDQIFCTFMDTQALGKADGKEAAALRWATMEDIEVGIIEGKPVNPLMVKLLGLMKKEIPLNIYLPVNPITQIAVFQTFSSLGIS